MIDAKGISKHFDDIDALKNVDLQIREGSIFGLVGTNGAGKSTFLRILAGVIRQDQGEIHIDGQHIFNHPHTKAQCFFISDDPFFFSNGDAAEMCRYYHAIYPTFDKAYFEHLLINFDLPQNRKINTYSKGMKKQLAIICAIAAQTKYIFCDETFDGLDPVMRQGVKGLFGAAVGDRKLTAVITSHNLRELEDISDHVGLLHKGGVLLSRDLDDMKLNIHKVQAAFEKDLTRENFIDLDVVTFNRTGSIYTMVVRGEREDIMTALRREGPLLAEMLPLSLEEIFISETEVKGYDIKNLLV